MRKGLHVSEYGILDDATGETTTCATEAEVYERLGLPYIEPELREDRGELEPGFKPPKLIELDDRFKLVRHGLRVVDLGVGLADLLDLTLELVR